MGLNFRTIIVPDGMVSLAFENGNYYLNMVGGDLETKLRLSPKAMDAFLELFWLQQPVKTALITICPEGETQAAINTNNVPLLDILDGLDALTIQIAKQLVEEAQLHVGKDPKRVAKWIDYMRQRPEQN